MASVSRDGKRTRLVRRGPDAIQLPFGLDEGLVQEQHGSVYTRPWVVELMLDLAGYAPDRDLVGALAVEPAVGDGAFVSAMARRLIESCRRQGRPVLDCRQSLRGYDLNVHAVEAAQQTLAATLMELAVSPAEAACLAEAWIRAGNYLFAAPTLERADFVIGNPPYIRLEDIGDEIAAAYRSMYRTMRGRADIYIAFFEAALRQLKPGGVCAFICADRWMLNQYGSELRAFVTSSFAVETVIEMHTADAFERDVSAYPAITVIRRDEQGSVVVARAEADAGAAGAAQLARAMAATRARHENGHARIGLQATRVDSWFDGSDPWPCASPERLQILRRLEDEFLPLESEVTETRVGIGVATGLDDVFITTDPELVELSRLLPLALASDTVTGDFRWSSHYLVDPWGPGGLVNLADFPRMEQYLLQHRDRLVSRHVARRAPQNWHRTIDRVHHALTTKRKLYIPDIKDRIHPVIDEGQTYPHHNLYVVHSGIWDLDVLGGLLFSAIGQFFVECYGVRMRGGWLRFQAQYLRRIRVPRPDDITLEQAAGLRDAFRRRDRVAATQIALQVYRLDYLPVGDEGSDAGDPAN